MVAMLNIDSPVDPKVAERLAVLLALPLRDEPETDEERAMFDEVERRIVAGDLENFHDDTQLAR